MENKELDSFKNSIKIDTLVSNLVEKYKIKDIDKVSIKLLEILIDDKKLDVAVDLFINDNVNSFEYTKNNKYINAHATYTFNIDTNKTSYTLNDIKSTKEAINQYMSAQEFFFMEKKKLREKMRQENIKKITSILQTNKKLNALSNTKVEYIGITLNK